MMASVCCSAKGRSAPRRAEILGAEGEEGAAARGIVLVQVEPGEGVGGRHRVRFYHTLDVASGTEHDT